MDTAFLKKIPLFAALDETALEELGSYLQEQVLPAHQTIFWMDERGDQLYILVNGKVRISFTDEHTREITLAILEPGAFFGELSMIDGGPHLATARCMQETRLLTLDRHSFYRFLHANPQLGDTMLETLSARLRSNTARIQNVVNVNRQLEANRNSFQRFVDKTARSLTSSTFLTVYISFILLWIGMQVYLYKKIHAKPILFLDEPPTFFILSFLITLSSFLLNVLILNSQSRTTENDRIRGEIEYQVNLKSQTEVIKLQYKMDKLSEMVTALASEKAAQEEKLGSQ